MGVMVYSPDLTRTTTLGQSELEKNSNEEVTLYSLEFQNWNVTTNNVMPRITPWLGKGSASLQRMQSAYILLLRQDEPTVRPFQIMIIYMNKISTIVLTCQYPCLKYKKKIFFKEIIMLFVMLFNEIFLRNTRLRKCSNRHIPQTFSS